MTELMTSMQPGLATVSVLFVVSALVLCVALWSVTRSQRQTRLLRKELTQLRSDIRALTTSSVGVGGRVLELERRLRRLAAEQQQPKQEVDIYESANQPYDHAIDLAKQGMEVGEIATMCGISRNEAELIQMMNRFKQAS